MMFSSEIQGCFNIHKSINVTHDINRLNKNDAIIIDSETAFHKTIQDRNY